MLFSTYDHFEWFCSKFIQVSACQKSLDCSSVRHCYQINQKVAYSCHTVLNVSAILMLAADFVWGLHGEWQKIFVGGGVGPPGTPSKTSLTVAHKTHIPALPFTVKRCLCVSGCQNAWFLCRRSKVFYRKGAGLPGAPGKSSLFVLQQQIGTGPLAGVRKLRALLWWRG